MRVRGRGDSSKSGAATAAATGQSTVCLSAAADFMLDSACCLS